MNANLESIIYKNITEEQGRSTVLVELRRQESELAQIQAALSLAQYILTIPAVQDIKKSQLESGQASPIADFEKIINEKKGLT